MNETSAYFPLMDLSYTAIVVIAVFAVGYKIWTWRADLCNGVLWMLCLMILAPACAFFLAIPVIYVRVDRLFAVPSLSTLLLYSAVAGGFISGFRGWVRVFSSPAPPLLNPSGGRRIATQCAVIVAGMATLFALGRHPYERPMDFDVYYARQPGTAAMIVLFNVAFGHALLASAHRCRAASRQPLAAEQARSLRLVSLGALTTSGYVFGSLIALAGRWAGVNLDAARTVAAPTCASAGAVLILSGSSGPTLARRARAARTWAGYVRGYWALRDLWARLDAVVAVPGAQGSIDRSRLALREVTHRLYRRTMALRDAQALVLDAIDGDLARIAARRAQTAGFTDEQTVLLLHTAALAATLHALEGGGRAQGASGARTDLPVPAVRDLDGELRWQLGVRGLLASPLLAEVLDEHAHGARLSGARDREGRTA